MCARAKSIRSCLTLCDPMNWSPPDSPVHGVLQARILAWVALPFCSGSSRPRVRTRISYICLRCQVAPYLLAPPGAPQQSSLTTNYSGKDQRALKQDWWKTGYLHMNTKVFLHKLLLTTERKVAALQWKMDRNFPNWLSKLTSSKMGQNSVFSSACMLSLQQCPTLCDPMDWSLPGSSIHELLQARILERATISFSRVWYVWQKYNLNLFMRKFKKHSNWGTSYKNKSIVCIGVMSWMTADHPTPPKKNHAEIQCDPGLDSV